MLNYFLRIIYVGVDEALLSACAALAESREVCFGKTRAVAVVVDVRGGFSPDDPREGFCAALDQNDIVARLGLFFRMCFWQSIIIIDRGCVCAGGSADGL